MPFVLAVWPTSLVDASPEEILRSEKIDPFDVAETALYLATLGKYSVVASDGHRSARELIGKGGERPGALLARRTRTVKGVE